MKCYGYLGIAVFWVSVSLLGAPSATRAASTMYVGSYHPGTIEEFDAYTGAYAGCFASRSSFTAQVKYHDGELYSSSNSDVAAFDMHTGQLVRTIPTAGYWCFAFGPDDLLYARTPVGIERFDPHTGGCLGVFAASSGIEALSFGPNGNLYAIDDTQLIEYDGQTGALVGALSIALSPYYNYGMTVGTNGHMYVADHFSGVQEVDLGTGTIVRTLAPPSNLAAIDLAFGPSGNLFVSYVDGGWGSGAVYQYDTQSGELLGLFAARSQAWGIAFADPAVPEPGSLLLLVLGGVASRRRW